jgi:hypothetical protein
VPIVNALTFSDFGAGGASAAAAGGGAAASSLGASAVFEHAASIAVTTIARNGTARVGELRSMGFS